MSLSRRDALTLLGLQEGFDADELKRARRRALLVNHPDHGGSSSGIADVEKACAILGDSPTLEPTLIRRGSDRPSFTIDVLPVEAFEFLLIAAAELGDVANDDPPYRLEIRMHEPRDTWVVLDVVPDAGRSTISIYAEGPSPFLVENIRDAWVEAVNQACLG